MRSFPLSSVVPPRVIAIVLFLFAVLVVLAPPAHAQTGWKPDRTVEMVVFTSAGGGNDKTVRLMQKIWQETKLVDAIVSNKVGGGGAIAFAYTSQKTGDANVVAIAEANLLTNHIAGRSTVNYTDLTPLAFVNSDPVALAVRVDSPYRTLKDFAEQLRKSPGSLAISVGSTLGAINHFGIALLAKNVGVDPRQLKVLVFAGGAEAVTNVLGGHIDAMVSAASSPAPGYRAGTMRILGLSSPQRSPSLPEVPTFREQGYDVVMQGWSIFVGPKGLSPAQIAYWEDVFRRTVEHEDWKKDLALNIREWGYRNSQETLALLRREYDQSKALMTDLGLVK